MGNMPFQLHHTGIKTVHGWGYSLQGGNFNCTIQELKHKFDPRQPQLFR
ncbi:hypothetical protein HMPREF1554_02182 [Porphyromonas gingivalis F0569]|nr:hypothetical protein HMPREF1554_02182 [Porphyromonas gingivalis F0569]